MDSEEVTYKMLVWNAERDDDVIVVRKNKQMMKE